MIVKEFRQVRRDHRTLGMMIFMPILMLIVFGYAASFDVKTIPVEVVGPTADRIAGLLPTPFKVEKVDAAAGRSEAEIALRDGDFAVAFVTGPASSGATGGGQPAPVAATVLVDGSQLFIATATRAAYAIFAQKAPAGTSLKLEILFNPALETSAMMVPGLAAMILLFVGTIITSLGVVRERQAGTLEQLAVMPFRPRDVFVGKIAPYFLVAAVDMTVVILAGMLLFDVPFRGSVLALGLGALLFLFVTLGIGVMISSVSDNQGQAIQLALMTLLPQVMLSGLIFPLSSMPPGVRWIGYLLPLTYFVDIARGVMLRGAPISALWPSYVYLAVIGGAVFGAATMRFRAFLAPGGGRGRGAGERSAGDAAR